MRTLDTLLSTRIAELGMDTESFAEKIELTPGAVRNWLDGVYLPSRVHWDKICDLLDIDPKEFRRVYNFTRRQLKRGIR